jgi:Tol biopolymer transport system component
VIRLSKTPLDASPTLSPGEHLGPYEIVKPLGAGGMGQVYRARDPRLRRDVAIKVLHPTLAMTPEHVARLVREARAAGSLNHPNILSVYDVEADTPTPYIVSELLQGEPLSHRLARGPLPCRKALEIGIEVAEALGAAHAKGIWHRDVKPSNVFLTGDGHVKLIDFGLVKLKTKATNVGPEDSTVDDTRAGGIHGTLGYMSPEQLLGEAVDNRTDIFALGAVLYEMVAGLPAFRRASASETTRALLSEEPIELLPGKATIAPALAVVVQRCLSKSREERFQSARDLAFHLRQIQDGAMPQRAVARGRRIRLLTAVGLAAAAIVAVAVSLWLGRFIARPTMPSFQQLTFHRGRIGGARFASEAGAVVYSEARERRPLEVWWISGPDSPEARSLGHEGADVLSVRPGKLALSLRRRFLVGARFVGTLADAPLGEGSPLELANNVEDADWDHAGERVAAVRSASVGEESRLEYPIGNVLYRTTGSIHSPRFSRDGRLIAFLEDPKGLGKGGHVSVVDLQGRLSRLTDDWASARGLAWSPGGKEIWFAAGDWSESRVLRAVDLEKRQRIVDRAPAALTLWDVAADGRVLLGRDEERRSLVGVPPGESAERDLSWFDSSGLADVSEDGRQILFDDRFGVYVRRTDGSPPVRLGLTEGSADDFSPDGTRVLATTASGRRLVVLPAGPGDPTPLEPHGITSYRGSLWFPDGEHILFNGTQAEGGLRSYVQDLRGGAPVPLTPVNRWVLSISADGQWAAATGPDQGVSVWPVAGGPPRLVPHSRAGDRPVAWSEDGRWLWVFRRGEVPAEVSRLEVSTGRRILWKTLQPLDSTGVYSITNFNVTRDGRAYFYSYDRQTSHLYLATGLR